MGWRRVLGRGASAAVKTTTAHEILLVPQQFRTIQAALDVASGPTTIVVAPEQYAETLHILDKPYVVLQSSQLSRRVLP